MKLYEAIAQLMQYKLDGNYTLDQEIESCDKIDELLDKYDTEQFGMGIYFDPDESSNQKLTFVGHFMVGGFRNAGGYDKTSHVITLRLNPFKMDISSTDINNAAESYINDVYLPMLQTEITEEI